MTLSGSRRLATKPAIALPSLNLSNLVFDGGTSIDTNPSKGERYHRYQCQELVFILSVPLMLNRSSEGWTQLRVWSY